MFVFFVFFLLFFFLSLPRLRRGARAR